MAAVLGTGGCGPACDDHAAASLSVSVVDADGERVCGAAVAAVRGGERFALEEIGECRYAGPSEQAGTFVVEVDRPGARSMGSEPVVVGADECHVITEEVAITFP